MIRWHKYRGQTTWPKFCNSGIGLRAGSLPPLDEEAEWDKKEKPQAVRPGGLDVGVVLGR